VSLSAGSGDNLNASCLKAREAGRRCLRFVSRGAVATRSPHASTSTGRAGATHVHQGRVAPAAIEAGPLALPLALCRPKKGRPDSRPQASPSALHGRGVRGVAHCVGLTGAGTDFSR
jgi:hypothetical protein